MPAPHLLATNGTRCAHGHREGPGHRACSTLPRHASSSSLEIRFSASPLAEASSLEASRPAPLSGRSALQMEFWTRVGFCVLSFIVVNGPLYNFYIILWALELENKQKKFKEIIHCNYLINTSAVNGFYKKIIIITHVQS